jgi:hypothetical protein
MQVRISGFWRLYAAKIGNLLHVCLQLLALALHTHTSKSKFQDFLSVHLQDALPSRSRCIDKKQLKQWCMIALLTSVQNVVVKKIKIIRNPRLPCQD